VNGAFRRAAPADVPALAALYRETALALGPQVYSAKQTRAWARATDDAAHFARYILDADTWVADAADGWPSGFCGIAVHGTTGEVHSLYVRAALTRRGLGTALLGHALAHARAAGARHFEAWATPFSRPVFERAGLRLERVVAEPYQGVLFDRFRMATA
jgi:putative acetyltransferase